MGGTESKGKRPAGANGKTAGRSSRDHVLCAADDAGLTMPRIMGRLAEALDATRTVAKYDTDKGRWEYSDPMVDNGARLTAIDKALTVLGAYPNQKLEIEANADEWADRLEAARRRAEEGAKRRAASRSGKPKG